MSDSQKVGRRLKAFHLLPFWIASAGLGKSPLSLLRDWTGLSKAKIASGQLDTLRPSTFARIRGHQERLVTERFKGDPDSRFRYQEHMATMPRTHAGQAALLASWIHSFEDPPSMTLPMSKEVALELDDLIVALLSACEADNLLGFKAVAVRHFERHDLTIRPCSQPGSVPIPEDFRASWKAPEGWDQTGRMVERLLDHAYWDLIATLDAEWSSQYFSGRQREPLFPLLMARPQKGLLDGIPIESHRNVIYRPSRRLMEFLYALVFYRGRKTWPREAPSPKVLGEAVGEPASAMSNHFDGSSKLRWGLVNHYWDEMFKYFLPNTAPQMRAFPPDPMIALALHWQKVLLPEDGTNGKPPMLPDLDRYQELWALRRQQWDAAQGGRGSRDPAKRSHSADKPIEWPAWMKFNQSSSAA